MTFYLAVKNLLEGLYSLSFNIHMLSFVSASVVNDILQVWYSFGDD